MVWRNENGIQEVHMGGRNEGVMVAWSVGPNLGPNLSHETWSRGLVKRLGLNLGLIFGPESWSHPWS